MERNDKFVIFTQLAYTIIVTFTVDVVL